MKKFNPFYRGIVGSVILLLLALISNAQPLPVSFACDTGPSNDCNKIANWTFTTNTNTFIDGYPFVNCINNWTASHGSPQINKGATLGLNINHASMWSDAALVNGVLSSTGEGIAVGIPALVQGGNYELNFQMRYSSTGTAATSDLDNFFIVLMTCAAFNSIRNTNPDDFTIPAMPVSGTQVIYTGSNVSNLTWQNITQSFSPNAAYTVLWVFPRNTTAPPTGLTEAWLHIGLPVIKYVPFCTAANPTPVITNSSYFWYGGCGSSGQYISMITPNTTNNSDCYVWECPLQANFFSNIGNGNNQWYVNDVLITSGGYSAATGYTDISTPGILRLGGYNGGSNCPGTYKIQLRNTTYGSASLTSPTYVTFNRTLGPTIYTQYKESYSTSILLGLLRQFSGPNSIYTWSFPATPDFTFSDISTTTPEVQLNFGSSVTTSGINGTLTVSNSNCNNVYSVTLQYNPFLRMGTQVAQTENPNKILIYPNPVINNTTIVSSSEKIVAIEITGITNWQRKKFKIKMSNAVSIDVSGLNHGIYNCNITTDKGNYMEKLIIR